MLNAPVLTKRYFIMVSYADRYIILSKTALFNLTTYLPGYEPQPGHG